MKRFEITFSCQKHWSTRHEEKVFRLPAEDVTHAIDYALRLLAKQKYPKDLCHVVYKYGKQPKEIVE